MQTRLARIRRKARTHPKEVFTNLFHHLGEELLEVSFGELESGKAPGVDGVSKDEYGKNLRAKVRELVQRLQRGKYRPLPSRRREIPKGDGRTRPLGIPALEDKLVQRGLTAVLSAVYEEDFYDFSYGFRLERSCHDALKELSRNIGTKKVNWVVEADIKGFFDNVDHEWLLAMVAHRVKDPRVLRLIRRFLKAGVMVKGKHLDTERGTPQGGVISPLLANVYLHYALDDWFAKVVKRYCSGEAYLVRYADDFVACFEYQQDALRFHTALAERLRKFKLEVEPSKTKILEFGRLAKRHARWRGETKVPTFDFLGFTHYCGTSRSGRFKLKWRTAKKRFRAKVRAIKEWIRAHLTWPLRQLWAMVNRKLEGHYQYFGVSDNWVWLELFRRATMKLLLKLLNRRSQRRSFTYAGFLAYVDRYPLARPRRLVNLNSAFV